MRVIYVMKNKDNTRSKFGQRMGRCSEEICREVDSEYFDEYRCVVLYDLEVGDNDVESYVSGIRKIINVMAEKLEIATPEYYEIDPDRIVDVLDALMNLQKFSKCRLCGKTKISD